MKLLMLTPYLPYPPASGGQIRTLNLLKYLSRNHEITLVCLYKDDEEKQYAEHLKKYCKEIHLCKRAEKPWQPKILLKAIFSLLPFLIVRNFSQEAKITLAKLLKNESFDVIHAETFYVMPHIPKTKIPILLVEQTVEYKVYQHFVHTLPFFLMPLFYFDIMKLKYWERQYWKKASLVAAVSQADRVLIEEADPEVKTAVVANGAGDEMFIDKISPKKMSPIELLFVGNFSWLQNIEAANYISEHIYPELLKTKLDFKIIIAGQNAKKKLNYKESNRILYKTIDQGDSSEVKNLYHKATLFIAPIYGPGGTRLKILAAMAAGLPVVATRTGVEGLNMKNNVHVLLADNAKEFADEIVKIVVDKKQYDELRKNAYQLACEKYSWPAIAKELETYYKTIT